MTNKEFSSEFFIANRRRLQMLFAGSAPIILTANGMLQRNSDITFPFRQESNFWYLTGIDEPDIILVIDRGKEYLIVPDRDKNRQAFDGAIDHERLVSISGIDNIYGEKTGWQKLSLRLKKVKHIATLTPPIAFESHYGFYTNPARGRLIDIIKEINENLELIDLKNQFSKMRSVKQPEELNAIKRAIDITSQAFKQVVTKRKSFNYESDILRLVDTYFVKHGVEHAYQPIIAGGGNACVLHYVKNTEKLDNSLVLIDVGAEYCHYASDITRTYSLGPINNRQQSVHDAVVEVQDYALSILKPGITIRGYEKSIEQYMGEKLRELGLIKSVESSEVRRYYPHATSHFLGLDTHDIGDYDAPLEVGAVLTVEPGIYIPEESIGIRIEDNVQVTKSGVEVLSKNLPRTLE